MDQEDGLELNSSAFHQLLSWPSCFFALTDLCQQNRWHRHEETHRELGTAEDLSKKFHY